MLAVEMSASRGAVLTLVIAVLAAGAGGCSHGSAATAASPIRQLIAYSACMRRNGVPNFPDPNSRGNLVISPNLRIDPGSPQYRRAESACRKLSPQGGSGSGMTPAQQAQALAAVTRYAQCMREHGVPMANPFSGPNGGVGFTIPRGVDPDSELYKVADAACRHFLPNGA